MYTEVTKGHYLLNSIKFHVLGENTIDIKAIGIVITEVRGLDQGKLILLL